MSDVILTTVHKPPEHLVIKAQELAEYWEYPFIERSNYSIAALEKLYKVSQIVVYTQDGPVVHTGEGNLFFHLNMAQLRIKNIENGKHDHMISAMDLKPAMSLLDCTLGLATDAIVASYVSGITGRVTGLEWSKLLAQVSAYGLKNFETFSEPITAALRRIEVIHCDYYDYLKNLPDNSYDVVYFDPMFRRPIKESSQLKPIRSLVNPEPLAEAAFNEAVRVARYRAVMKECNGSPEFKRLGITKLVGGKYSSIHYGVLEKGRCR